MGRIGCDRMLPLCGQFSENVAIVGSLVGRRNELMATNLQYWSEPSWVGMVEAACREISRSTSPRRLQCARPEYLSRHHLKEAATRGSVAGGRSSSRGETFAP